MFLAVALSFSDEWVMQPVLRGNGSQCLDSSLSRTKSEIRRSPHTPYKNSSKRGELEDTTRWTLPPKVHVPWPVGNSGWIARDVEGRGRTKNTVAEGRMGTGADSTAPHVQWSPVSVVETPASASSWSPCSAPSAT